MYTHSHRYGPVSELIGVKITGLSRPGQAQTDRRRGLVIGGWRSPGVCWPLLVKTLVIHVFFHSLTGVTIESQMPSREEEEEEEERGSCFHCQQQLFLQNAAVERKL